MAINIIRIVTIITVKVAINVSINSSSIITLTCIIIAISNIMCSNIGPSTIVSTGINKIILPKSVIGSNIITDIFVINIKRGRSNVLSTPALSLDTADVALTPKYSSSTVSKATTLTPTPSSSLASLVSLSPTTLSSVVSSALKLPKPSLSPVSSSPELLPTTQPLMVSSVARSLSSVSTAVALPPTSPFSTVSATVRLSPTT